MLMCDKEAQIVKNFFSFQSGQFALAGTLLCSYADKSMFPTKE